MQADNRERRVIASGSLLAAGALIVALSLFLASIFFLSLTLAHLRESFAWVEHTDQVLLEIAAIEADLIDAESAERGYLLTGESGYLEPYERARAGLDREVDALAALVADNPVQSERVRELRPVIDGRLAEFKQVIDLGPSRLEDAVRVIRTARNQPLTRAARERLELLREAEIRLLGERQERVHDAATLSVVATGGAALVSLASAGMGLFLFLRQRSGYRIRELQAELLHVSRLSSMGQTASMIAHEIRQPLSASATYLQTVRRLVEVAGLAQSDKINEAAQKAVAQLHRAGEIVGRMRRFVERRDAERRSERIDAVIDDAIALLGLDPGRITLRRRLDPGLPAVAIDRVEVQQVLINLMRNAVEAMAESPRRELALSAEAEKDMVRVGVGDTGPGLPPAVAERLFQPFVSTKADGMGLGLSICHTIIERHGGRIWTTPNPEGGTTFHFTLPASRAHRLA